MQRCGVFIRGTDRAVHLIKVDAASVYEAASKALQEWVSKDWYQEDAVLEVCNQGKIWRVHPNRVRGWQTKRYSRAPQQCRLTFPSAE